MSHAQCYYLALPKPHGRVLLSGLRCGENAWRHGMTTMEGRPAMDFSVNRNGRLTLRSVYMQHLVYPATLPVQYLIL